MWTCTKLKVTKNYRYWLLLVPLFNSLLC